MQSDGTKCPHENIIYCPLYVAAHEAGELGCDDGRLNEGGCAIERELDYPTAYARLCAARPRLCAKLAFAERNEAEKQQRQRNMRAAGLQ